MVGPAGGNRGGEMGGEGKGSGNGTPQPAAHLPFFSPLAAHHSAKRGSVERNLPICGVRFTICGVPPHGTTQHSFVACALTPTLRLRLVRGYWDVAPTGLLKVSLKSQV